MTASLIRITTEDGVALEAEQFVGESPRAVVVIAHPHPHHGRRYVHAGAGGGVWFA